jgi:hypothetical protein
MAYDGDHANRARELLAAEAGVTEKRMWPAASARRTRQG